MLSGYRFEVCPPAVMNQDTFFNPLAEVFIDGFHPPVVSMNNKSIVSVLPSPKPMFGSIYLNPGFISAYSGGAEQVILRASLKTKTAVLVCFFELKELD